MDKLTTFGSIDLLPDSRAKKIVTPKGRVFTAAGCFIPVYCANCGADGGLCPEEGMTFMFYLCNGCAEKYGKIAGTLMMPDEVFWQQLKNEQMTSYGRYLTEQELLQVVEEDASPLATLLLSRRNQGA